MGTARCLVCCLIALAFASCSSPWETPPLKQAISTDGAPRAIGPYSQAIKYGNLLFLSGQLAINPGSGQLLADASIEEQTRQAMDNLSAVLKASGMSMDNVLMATVYLKDMNDFPKVNEIFGRYFAAAPPARVTVAVAQLPKNAKIEISMIAGK
ncbi:MAG: RidA family protein [Deltaproteobacteria bacterium]|nr:RidA family protein [Deltaproteobacteria bacterium]